MQVSLLLLGYALARYVWDLSRTVSAVIATFAVFGALFYLSIVFAATVWETSVSGAGVRCSSVPPYLGKTTRAPLVKIRGRLSVVVQFRKLNESFITATLVRSIDEEFASRPQTTPGTPILATNIVDFEDEESTQASDTNCISTMFRFASGSDAIIGVTGFIPEINWTTKVRRVPLLEVCDCLCRSFEFLKDGRMLIRPGMQGQAYGSARALLHLRVQRLCAGATDGAHITASKVGSLFGYHSREDYELESTLQVLNTVFKKERQIQWQEFTFSDAHYCWLSYVLLCLAWATLRTRETPTKEVIGFVQHAFSKEPLPPPRVIADCLLIVDMIVGGLPQLDDRMLTKDKR